MKRLVRLVRDGWLILSAALLLFVVLECSYRGYSALRSSPPVAEPDLPGHPYADQPWYRDFFAELAHRSSIINPYVGTLLKPQVSPYLNIDSAGRRLVPQPAPAADAPRILMLGGSAMWGLTARDSFTIPALLAPALAARGISAEIVNLATPGFNSTQELAMLQREIAWGRRVDAAVFLNGYNDAASAMNNRVPGHTYSEDYIQGQVDLGNLDFGRTVLSLGRFSALIKRLQPPAPRHPPPPLDSALPLCGRAAAYYANVERVVQSVARAQGFPALVFLQAHNATTHKTLTAWEAKLERSPNLVACADSMAARLAPEMGRTFFDLRPLFDADTATVFVDRHSHVTETANRRIAEAMADRLAPLLRARKPSSAGR